MEDYRLAVLQKQREAGSMHSVIGKAFLEEERESMVEKHECFVERGFRREMRFKQMTGDDSKQDSLV